MRRLALVVRDLAPSQMLGHLSFQAAALCRDAVDLDISFLFESTSEDVPPPGVACMPLADGFGFGGAMVATCINTARRVAGMPGTGKRIFLAYDLDFHHSGANDYGSLASVYRDERLILVTRGRDYARLLSENFNREVLVAESLADIINIACGGEA